MLTITGLSRAYGGVFAVKDVQLDVEAGELRGIIGPNGAGKSTLFNLISGHAQAQRGTITFNGVRVDRLPAHRRARLGISIVFQGARLFSGMTVLENVMVGATATTKFGALAAALRLPQQLAEEKGIRRAAEDALAQVGLTEWADRAAESLPLGQQRRVQVARALASNPKLLLLDEPASGLREVERADLSRLIAELRQGGMTIILIEHDVKMVMRLATSITVLDLGEVIAEGTPTEVRSNPRVIAAYFGSEAPRAVTH